jgi:hypothetical protein
MSYPNHPYRPSSTSTPVRRRQLTTWVVNHLLQLCMKRYGHDVLRPCNREYVIGINQAGHSSQLSCRIVPSHASDNYYYDERKKASEKFAMASNDSFPAACRLHAGMQIDSWAGTCDEAPGVMHHHRRIRHHVATRSSQALRRGGLTSRDTHRTDPIDRQVMRGHDVAITRQWRQVYLSVTL